ncbi:radical SAM/SPASM domain-containing protein [Desulfopila sp. IMCC35008]|uniref:radical SAM/SPASM domain-containing protein n=1 Tax=Desulfopila sp. IMCC35008 TaxID=2653858 RepID=UPI0013D27AC0|nr:radical SAM/SPASM domain-containing protein [Desulfopila sp. IMCC35008]
MDFLQWAKSRTLPSALQTREGWVSFFEHYRTGEPHIHQIEPTNHCPYTCIMCPRHTRMNRKKGFMDFAVFQKIIDEISTYSDDVKNKEIELFHFGESLLHPEIAKMVSYTSEHNLKATLSINPCDLTQPLIDTLVMSNPYQIIISIDSMDPDKYRILRGAHANLDKAVINTSALLRSFQDAKSNTRLTVRMIVMHNNKDEKDSYTSFWRSQGAEVELRDFFPWNDRSLQELGNIEKYPHSMPCPFPWQYLVVQWNGDVVACCRDYNGQLILGNVRKQSLIEIWNGQRCTDLRNAIGSGTGLKQMCQECHSLYNS